MQFNVIFQILKFFFENVNCNTNIHFANKECCDFQNQVTILHPNTVKFFHACLKKLFRYVARYVSGILWLIFPTSNQDFSLDKIKNCIEILLQLKAF